MINCSCAVPSIKKRQICIARMAHPLNLGITSNSIRFFILVLTPFEDVIQLNFCFDFSFNNFLCFKKTIKSSSEVSHTFATLFADVYFRLDLINARTEQEFLELIDNRVNQLSDRSQSEVNPLKAIQKKFESKRVRNS